MYFDLQVNGYYGVDFQKPDLSADELHLACQKLAESGVVGILATIVTENVDHMCASLQRIVELRQRDPISKQIIAGIHIEGPFLNETDGYRGAHPRDAIRPADEEAMKRMLDAAGGLTRIVTLAPERDAGLRVTRMLAARKIVVSAGHCNPSVDQLKSAIDAGLSMFTHLGNGCPMQMHRHDNIIQRAFSLHEKLWLCFIGDGVHVPLFALGNYLRSIDLGRCVVVTDQIAPAGLGPGRYTLGRWDLIIGEDMVAMAPDKSHLVGSACTMPQIEANLRKLGYASDQIRQLVLENPKHAIA